MSGRVENDFFPKSHAGLLVILDLSFSHAINFNSLTFVVG